MTQLEALVCGLVCGTRPSGMPEGFCSHLWNTRAAASSCL